MRAAQQMGEQRLQTSDLASDLSPCLRSRIIQYIALVALPLALLWRPLFVGEAFFWGTPLLQFIPWQRLAAQIWRSGHLPLWNPLVGCGAPLAANYQTAAFYPLNALYLLLPAETALSWTVALHLCLAGWGAYRWGRAVGLDRLPAMIGALALQGSGFLVGRAALFPSIAVTFPWIPIWLWRTELLVQDTVLTDPSSKSVWREALWLGLTVGLGLLAGHAQTAFYGGLLVAAYALFRAIQGAISVKREANGARLLPSGARVLTLLLLALVVGVGLAAVQLLPTAELLLHSHRSTGVSDDLAMTYSFWPWRLITVVAPDFFGNPGAGTYWGYGAYWEDAVYVGLLPLLLGMGAVGDALRGRRESIREQMRAFAPTWRALTIFWAAATILALVLAMGKNTPLFPFLFRRLPGFDLFRAPARWLAIVTVTLAALAAIGAQRWPRGRRARRRGALGATLGGALLIGGIAAPALIPDVPATFGPATVRLGLTLTVAGALWFLRGSDWHACDASAIWWPVAVVAFVVLDLLIFGWPLVPTVDRFLYQGGTRTASVLQAQSPDARIYWPSDPEHQDRGYDAQYRVKFDYLSFDAFEADSVARWRGMREDQLPNANMLDGLPSANNFDPLLVDQYVDLIEAVRDAPHILNAMGVTHVASDRAWPEGEPVLRSPSATFYSLPDAPGRAWVVPRARLVAPGETVAAMKTASFDPASAVLLGTGTEVEGDTVWREGSRSSLALQDDPNRVTIRAGLDGPGYLVVADTWYPGWQVTVDGRPAELLRANHAFRAVPLREGQHTIEMAYRPVSVHVGGVISLATAALLVVAMLWNC